MTVSVIVPVYNVEKYLEECLQSLEKQTFSDIEVIVVNDGSKDNSGEIARRFCEKNSNFSYYEKENGGLMSAWLYGVSCCKGEYIGFVDSDDAVVPEMYEKMIRKAQETNADIVMCGRRDITLETQTESIDNWAEYYALEDMSVIYNNAFASLKGGNVSSARWNKIFKREVLLSNIVYCEDKSRYCEDRFIVPACLLTAKSFAYIPEALYIYRMRKGANSKTGNPALLSALDLLYRKQQEMLKDKALLNSHQKFLEIAKLNYIKLAMERNLFLCQDKKTQQLTLDWICTRENRRLVLQNKDECVNKFGKYLYYSMKLRSKFLLRLGAKLYSKLQQDTTTWYD